MLRDVRGEVVLNTMLMWGYCCSSISTAVLAVPAYLLGSEELIGLAILAAGFLLGVVLGFWIGIVREMQRLAREGAEAPR
jgi:hypothetical protein